MNALTRRAFIGAGPGVALSGLAAVALPKRSRASIAGAHRVHFLGPGIGLSARDHVEVLRHLTGNDDVLDDYSRGGAVDALERQFAALLGKEAAVFMPSGTLANHLAVRALANNRRRVAVQESAHLYNDSGDCAQQLSGLTLVPLSPGGASFTWDNVKDELARAESGRVATDLGAISIESPVRRLDHAAFDFSAMERISLEARRREIGLHLDGALLFIAAAYSGRTLTAYTALFDTVFVSLWKCFNAANGAILAGPRALLSNMYQVRRMFGGSIKHAWPDAVIASYYAEGYLDRMRRAVATAEKVWTSLSSDDRFAVLRVPEGTCTLRLAAKGIDADRYRASMARVGVDLPEPEDGVFVLRVNETACLMSAEMLIETFKTALVASPLG
jgi:threonine aldolase